jgi:membrane-associated phospholipid phosphatase
MSAVPLPFDPGLSSPTDRAIRAAGALPAAFLALATPAMALYARGSRDVLPLAAHLLTLLAASALLLSRRPALEPLRDWMPLAVGPYLYVELRWLIQGVGRPHADLLVQRWEQVLFPTNPAATWAPQMPNLVLSEALHFAYASYYALVLLPPILLYLRGRRTEYAITLLALALVYAVCFTTYLAFPVDGPRFLVGPASAPDGPVRTFVLHLLAAGSSRGTAFPSSHVAASVVASLCALRFQPRLGAVIALLTAGLTLGTVYGGFHYGVDAVAGLIVGAASWLVAMTVWRALSTPGAQSATAA